MLTVVTGGTHELSVLEKLGPPPPSVLAAGGEGGQDDGPVANEPNRSAWGRGGAVDEPAR